MNLLNRTAVITGSASGIGRAIAVSLARRGCSLALADVNDAGLSETARRAQLAQADGLPLREYGTAHYRVVVSFATHYREALQLRFSHYNVSATIEIFAAPRARIIPEEKYRAPRKHCQQTAYSASDGQRRRGHEKTTWPFYLREPTNIGASRT
jgi:hypothetical protein